MPSLEFVKTWFKNAATEAQKQGRKDSALLWKDGLAQLLAAETEIAQLKARNEKLERVAKTARVLLGDKIILDTVCFPHDLFKKYQELSDALKCLEAQDAPILTTGTAGRQRNGGAP